MMHISGRTGNRHGLTALVYLVFVFIAIAAGATYVDAQPRAFVANTNANTITVIDTATDARTTIDVGPAPRQVVISKDGTRAFVANTGSNSISVIHTDDNTVDTILLNDRPASIALSPDGAAVYVFDAGGFLETCSTTTHAPCASVFVATGNGKIAVTPDGGRVYIASELVYVFDTKTGNVSSFVAEAASSLDQGNFAVDVAILPDGRLYVAVVTYHYDWMGFRADGGILVVDTSSGTPVVGQTIPLFSLPGSLALSADGTRAFVGIQSYWADTLYGAAFMPGRWVATIDTTSDTAIAWTDLGAEANTFAGTHIPAGLAVAPDRSAVFVSVPNIDSILTIDTATSLVARSFQIDGGGPTDVAVPPDAAAKPKAFTIEAIDDGPAAPLSAFTAGLAVASVLANDKVGGGPATPANVTLSFVSALSPSLTLDTATGAVWIAADAAVGSHSLTYQICDVDHADNCGQAVVRVAVRPQFHLQAGPDGGESYAGAKAIANVLANDLVDETAASFDSVALSGGAGDTGLTLNADGSVSVAAGAAPGTRSLSYQICDVTSAGNCASGTVTVNVVRRPIQAGADSGSAARTGGTAVANVLANDTLEPGVPATLARVTLSSLSSSDPGVTLNTATGAVSVAAGAAAGVQTLEYEICEIASPDNCADGTVSVTVKANAIVAVGESARASNKNGSTPIRNVLANDSLGGAPATLANVILSQVSTSNSKVRLNADGSVSVADKAGSSASLIYQICEIGSPANCARATVSIDLSGKN